MASVPPHKVEESIASGIDELMTNIFCFICGGAFEGLDKIIETRMDRKSMGFNAEVGNHHEDNVDRLLSQVLPYHGI